MVGAGAEASIGARGVLALAVRKSTKGKSMDSAIKKIVILGGGSAGWMTAAYLVKALGDAVEIVLVESSNIKTVGVGEATFSTIKLFFDFLGLREHEWMPHCGGSYKVAIRFEHWTKDMGYFYHPFQRYEMACGVDAGKWWLKLLRDQERFDQACFAVARMCDAMRSPRYLDGRVFDQQVSDFY